MHFFCEIEGVDFALVIHQTRIGYQVFQGNDVPGSQWMVPAEEYVGLYCEQGNKIQVVVVKDAL